MMRLSVLPTELKLCIADRLWTGDLFSFALTSKEQWAVFGESAIKEHRALREKYGAVTATESELTVWELLNDIIRTPRIANYVRSLELPSYRGDYYHSNILDARDVTDDTVRLPPQQIELFVKAPEEDNLHRLLVDYKDEDETVPTLTEDVGETTVAIENGSDGPILALLLSRLPKLEKLCYEDCGDSAHVFFLINEAALEYGYPQVNPGLAFQNLTNVRLSHWDMEFCIDWEYARYFICMPNLRKLSAHMMGSEVDHEVAEREIPEYARSKKFSKLPRSHVKSLEFSYCNLATENMIEVLSGTEALENFFYNCAGAIVASTSYEAKGILAALKKFFAHSLERLHLDDESCDGGGRIWPTISLRDFQKLRHIRMGWSDLVPNEDELDNADKDGDDEDEALAEGFFNKEESSKLEYRLVDLLPASLEYLYLEGVLNDDSDKVVEMIKQKDQYLPNLKRIHVDDGGSKYNSSKHQSVKLVAEEAGLTWERYEEYREGFEDD